jgi:hypothetical protein
MNQRTICRCAAAMAAAALTLVLAAGAAASDPPAATTAAPGKTSAPVPAKSTPTAAPKSSQPSTKPAPPAEKPASKPTPPAEKIAKTTPPADKPSPAASSEPDSGKAGYTLKGGQDRTDFRSLTIEGEDRVHVEIERPALALQLNPSEVKGLEFGTAADVLDRTAPDLTTQFLAVSATGTSPYTSRPWLRQFASGAVARFQPAVHGTERWKLSVADSRGQTVAQFSGQGDAPKEIVWDGRSVSGAPVTPGITYSYVFEAVDKAGNKRNFVGQGFRVTAYRLESPQGPVLIFSGQMLREGVPAAAYGGGSVSRSAPPIVLEAASTLNQSPRVSQPVRVSVTARSYEAANASAKQVAGWISDLTIGDPARVQAVAEVQPDAPEGGTIRIAIADATGAVPAAAPATPDKKNKDSKKKSKG